MKEVLLMKKDLDLIKSTNLAAAPDLCVPQKVFELLSSFSEMSTIDVFVNEAGCDEDQIQNTHGSLDNVDKSASLLESSSRSKSKFVTQNVFDMEYEAHKQTKHLLDLSEKSVSFFASMETLFWKF
ncbi:hypothetical protein HELRODRAFT_168216 [Helobdella robusta]|uniref:Uncharacterized protein n=1 Tax=Helobdella robusta TaxID=6412 RepID=T1F0B7_HELRO|nr:hypothetical protein HELRODRAFT_168216 [Helobdella robusta]ESO09254.1 hypothetical protein HELRODRAFT_168216 [Helobdella robusta]